MSGIQIKKGLVLGAYPHSKTWPAKVAKMSETQIVAVYLRLVRQGKIRA